ncbi:hypothetical protein [Methanoregula sp.]|uniref:hypothetical protein n=2 Tax=Methanoregula sp. TaxID=2052170 RepID=UPI003C323079
MTPKDTISQLIQEAVQYKYQAEQALSNGINNDQAPIFGELLVQTVVPYGAKGLTRKIGRSILNTSKNNVNSSLRHVGDQLLGKCESSVKDMSIKIRTLSYGGNSSNLLKKFNRVRRLKSAVSFYNTLILVLQELQNQDLIWNRDIPLELALRKTIMEHEKKEKSLLRISSPKLVRSAQSVEIYNRLSVAEKLKNYPNVQESVLGAIDRLHNGGPDALRHCVISCRAAIEALCIQVGKNEDWKNALNSIFPSDTDRKSIKSVWIYLSNKGAHGGSIPAKDDAEYALKITIVTLEQIINKSSGR